MTQRNTIPEVSGPNWSSSIATPPAAPTLSEVASGAIPPQDLSVIITYQNSQGESAQSAISSLLVDDSNVLLVTSPPAATSEPLNVAPATGWNVYVRDNSLPANRYRKQNLTLIPIGTDWQEPDTGLVNGALVPSNNNSVVPGFKAVTHY